MTKNCTTCKRSKPIVCQTCFQKTITELTTILRVTEQLLRDEKGSRIMLEMSLEHQKSLNNQDPNAKDITVQQLGQSRNDDVRRMAV